MKEGGTVALAFRIAPNPASPSKLPSFDPDEARGASPITAAGSGHKHRIPAQSTLEPYVFEG
jgi:hypothetical protein